MNPRLALEIAVTHLVTKKKQSLVAMLGVMFGISMFIIMISFMTGVNTFLEDLAMDNTPDVHISNPVQIRNTKIIPEAAQNDTAGKWFFVFHQRPKNDLPRIKNAPWLRGELENLPQVAGVAPLVSSQVFFNNGPVQIQGEISGIDVRKQEQLFGLDRKMEVGSL